MRPALYPVNLSEAAIEQLVGQIYPAIVACRQQGIDIQQLPCALDAAAHLQEHSELGGPQGEEKGRQVAAVATTDGLHNSQHTKRRWRVSGKRLDRQFSGIAIKPPLPPLFFRERTQHPYTG